MINNTLVLLAFLWMNHLHKNVLDNPDMFGYIDLFNAGIQKVSEDSEKQYKELKANNLHFKYWVHPISPEIKAIWNLKDGVIEIVSGELIDGEHKHFESSDTIEYLSIDKRSLNILFLIQKKKEIPGMPLKHGTY